MSVQTVNCTGRLIGNSSPLTAEFEQVADGSYRVIMRQIQFTCDLCGAQTTLDNSDIKRWWAILDNGSALTIRPLRHDDTSGKHACSGTCLTEMVKQHAEAVIAEAVVEKVMGAKADHDEQYQKMVKEQRVMEELARGKGLQAQIQAALVARERK